MCAQGSLVPVFGLGSNASSLAGAAATMAEAPCPPQQVDGPIRSRFRGLSWDKKHQGWRVRIYYSGKQRHVGRFEDDVTAAKAYDKAAVYLYGANAITNFGLEACQADPTEVSAFIIIAKEQADQEQQARSLQRHHHYGLMHQQLAPDGSLAPGGVHVLQHAGSLMQQQLVAAAGGMPVFRQHSGPPVLSMASLDSSATSSHSSNSAYGLACWQPQQPQQTAVGYSGVAAAAANSAFNFAAGGLAGMQQQQLQQQQQPQLWGGAGMPVHGGVVHQAPHASVPQLAVPAGLQAPPGCQYVVLSQDSGSHCSSSSSSMPCITSSTSNASSGASSVHAGTGSVSSMSSGYVLCSLPMPLGLQGLHGLGHSLNQADATLMMLPQYHAAAAAPQQHAVPQQQPPPHAAALAGAGGGAPASQPLHGPVPGAQLHHGSPVAVQQPWQPPQLAGGLHAGIGAAGAACMAPLLPSSSVGLVLGSGGAGGDGAAPGGGAPCAGSSFVQDMLSSLGCAAAAASPVTSSAVCAAQPSAQLLVPHASSAADGSPLRGAPLQGAGPSGGVASMLVGRGADAGHGNRTVAPSSTAASGAASPTFSSSSSSAGSAQYAALAGAEARA